MKKNINLKPKILSDDCILKEMIIDKNGDYSAIVTFKEVDYRCKYSGKDGDKFIVWKGNKSVDDKSIISSLSPLLIDELLTPKKVAKALERNF